MLEIAYPHGRFGENKPGGVRAFLAVSEPVVFAGQSRRRLTAGRSGSTRLIRRVTKKEFALPNRS